MPSVVTRALPLLAALVAAALLASQALAWWGLESAVDDLRRLEAELMLETLVTAGRRAEGPPTQAQLDDTFRLYSPRGLRYLAVQDRGGRVEAGTPLLGHLSGRIAVSGDRVRAERALPPPPFARGRGGPPGFPPPGFGPPGKAPHGKAPPPGLGPRPRFGPPPGKAPPPGAAFPPGATFGPRVVVEIEPQLEAGLRADAFRTLLAAAVAALLFVLFGLALRHAIKQREEEARRADRDRRLAELGAMSAVLAHEIRNPLASLKGHAQLLLETLPADEAPARRKTERVVDEAVRLEQLVQSLLAYVRSGDLDREPVDLRTPIRQAAERVGLERLELRLGDAPVTALADAARLTQALVNVMGNAVELSDGPVEVTLRRSLSGATIEVDDDGPGLEPGAEGRLFEPFFTTRVRGTGLGLAITKRIVDGHGGSVRAENTERGGARFTIELPRGDA